jgi:hypothetical protein
VNDYNFGDYLVDNIVEEEGRRLHFSFLWNKSDEGVIESFEKSSYMVGFLDHLTQFLFDVLPKCLEEVCCEPIWTQGFS